MGLEGKLQQVDSLLRDDIYVLKIVDVRPVLRRCLFGVVCCDLQRTLVA